MLEYGETLGKMSVTKMQFFSDTCVYIGYLLSLTFDKLLKAEGNLTSIILPYQWIRPLARSFNIINFYTSFVTFVIFMKALFNSSFICSRWSGNGE